MYHKEMSILLWEIWKDCPEEEVLAWVLKDEEEFPGR